MGQGYQAHHVRLWSEFVPTRALVPTWKAADDSSFKCIACWLSDNSTFSAARSQTASAVTELFEQRLYSIKAKCACSPRLFLFGLGSCEYSERLSKQAILYSSHSPGSLHFRSFLASSFVSSFSE